MQVIFIGDYNTKINFRMANLCKDTNSLDIEGYGRKCEVK